MSFQRSRITPTRPIVSAAILIVLLIVAAVKGRDKPADGHSAAPSQQSAALAKPSAADDD